MSILQEPDPVSKQNIRKRLKNYKRYCRKNNWKRFITDILSNRKHWALFNSMEKNRSLLGKRETKDNVIENRKTFTANWKREMSKIYTCPDNLPDVPEFD